MFSDTIRLPNEAGYFNAVRLPVVGLTPVRRPREDPIRLQRLALGRPYGSFFMRDRDSMRERSLLAS